MKPNALPKLFAVSALAAALALMLPSGCTDVSVSTPEDMAITYNLKLESGDGGSVSPTAQNNIAAGTPVSVTATPNNGYIFSHWTLTSGLARFADANSASTSVLLGWNATIKANFIARYTVTFNTNGATGNAPAAVTVNSGTNITLPDKGDIVKKGYKSPDSIYYTFGGWNTNSSGTGTNYSVGTTYNVTGNITLYARWTPIFTVKFDGNGATSGDIPATITADSGKSVTLPSKGDLARIGYTFDGWNEKSDGTGTNYGAGASYSVRSIVTLYAKWTVNTYALTTNVNPSSGGTVSRSPDQTSYNYGTNVAVTATPNTGYMFTGWSGDTSGTANPVTIPISKNKTLTANFQIVYAVTVSSTGNGASGNGSYAPGATVTVTAGTAPSGYRFTNWTTESSGVTFSNANNATTTFTMPANAVTVTANFETIFIDSRDSKTYRTVRIGTQTWMAENLNYQTSSGSWCYLNSADSCTKYGRLYDWAAAKTACPTGWRLPDTADWRRLVTTAGGTYSGAGKKLKSTSGWNNYIGQSGNGTDDYGFSALPGGTRDYDDGSFSYAGVIGYWWTATESGGGNAYGRFMTYDFDGVVEVYNNKGYGFSVRCVEAD